MKKEERRTRRPKQVPFHNRTHRNFLLSACVETPHSDMVEDNEAISKMTIEGRIPTMQDSDHETRVPHQQCCSRLVIGQNLFGPGNPNQTCWYQKPNLPQPDERPFLPCWTEPPSPSVHYHGPIRVLHRAISAQPAPQTMSKRLMQEAKPGEDERVVAKSKPMRNLVSKTINWSPTVLTSSASCSPGILTSKSSIWDSVGTEFEWNHSIESTIWFPSLILTHEDIFLFNDNFATINIHD